MGVQSGKRRQQARVDVQHAALPGLDQEGCQQAHVPAEADEFRASLTQQGVDRPLMRLPVTLEGPVIHDRGRDGARGGEDQAGGIGTIGEHQDDFGRECLMPAASSSAAMFEPRPLIMIATRRLIQASLPAGRCAPEPGRSAGLTVPIRLTFSPSACRIGLPHRRR